MASAVCLSNCDSQTRRQSAVRGTPVCCITRMSAKTTLDASKPAAGCRTNETVLAMRQPVRTHTWACSRCAAARLLHDDSSLQVCCASSCALPAMHGSHCNDRAFCARAAGSCSVSSSTIRLAVCDRPHVGGALGERAVSSVCSRGCRVIAAAATAGHVHMALSRSPAAAGIVPPRQWLAWIRL